MSKRTSDNTMEIINNLETKDLLPIIALMSGWMLSELSSFFRTNGDKKRNLSKALTELLDIHHSLVGEHLIKDVLMKKFNLQAEHMHELQKVLDVINVDIDEVSKRYNQAVDMISEYDPLLAFQLRNKDQISSYLRKLRDLAKDDDNEVEIFMNGLADNLISELIPALEEAILNVSKKRGFVTWYKIKKIVNNKQLPDQFIKLLDEIPLNSQ